MKQLFKFTGENPSNPWTATNDGVMGGLSEGGAKLVEEGMLFSGVLSLENNGGFSSVHANGNYDLSDYKGIRICVLGDGRTYQLRLQSDAVYRDEDNLEYLERRKAAITAAGRQERHIDERGQWYLKACATEMPDVPDDAYYDGAQTIAATEAMAISMKMPAAPTTTRCHLLR